MASLNASATARSRSRASAVALCVVAIVAAACGGQPATQSPQSSPAPASTSTTSKPTGTVAPSPTGSGIASASPSGSQDNSLGSHVDQALEDMLPDQVGPYPMYKGSYPLSMFMNSAKSNDRALYAEWLSRLNVKAETTSLAIAIDSTDQQVITVLGFRPAGADGTKLFAAFKDSLDKLRWPNTAVLLAEKPVIQATDVGGGRDGTDAVGYAYAKNGVLFLVVTQDAALALQAFIALP